MSSSSIRRSRAARSRRVKPSRNAVAAAKRACFSWSYAVSTRSDASEISASGRRPLRKRARKATFETATKRRGKVREPLWPPLAQEVGDSFSATFVFASNRSSAISSVDRGTSTSRASNNAKHSLSSARAFALAGARDVQHARLAIRCGRRGRCHATTIASRIRCDFATDLSITANDVHTKSDCCSIGLLRRNW